MKMPLDRRVARLEKSRRKKGRVFGLWDEHDGKLEERLEKLRLDNNITDDDEIKIFCWLTDEDEEPVDD
jgi:hypothetical protein